MKRDYTNRLTAEQRLTAAQVAVAECKRWMKRNGGTFRNGYDEQTRLVVHVRPRLLAALDLQEVELRQSEMQYLRKIAVRTAMSLANPREHYPT